MTTDEMYLENLDQWIFDQGKIVTYHTLSQDLEVPVDVAKQMLFHFSQRSKSVNVLYLVSGIDKNNVYRVNLVPKKNLEKAKKKFETLASVHIYSLQKGLPEDSSAIWSTVHDSVLELQKKDPYNNSFVTNKWAAVAFSEGEDGAAGREDLEKGQVYNSRRIQASYAADVSASEKHRMERQSSNSVNKETDKPQPKKEVPAKGKQVPPAKKSNSLTNFFQTGVKNAEPVKVESMEIEKLSEEEVKKASPKKAAESPKQPANSKAKKAEPQKAKPKVAETKKLVETKKAGVKKESPKKQESPKKTILKKLPEKPVQLKRGKLLESSESDDDFAEKEKAKAVSESESDSDSEDSIISGIRGAGGHLCDDDSLSENDFELKNTKKSHSRLKKKRGDESSSSSEEKDPDADLYDSFSDDESVNKNKKLVAKKGAKQAPVAAKKRQTAAVSPKKAAARASKTSPPKAKQAAKEAPRKGRGKTKKDPEDEAQEGEAKEEMKEKAPRKSQPRKRKREEVEEVVDEKQQRKDDESKRKFASYFSKPETSSIPTGPVLKKEVTQRKTYDTKGYLVLQDVETFVEDKEAQKKLEEERFRKEEKKKKESEEPAAKRRKVSEGPKKQGTLTAFFKAK